MSQCYSSRGKMAERVKIQVSGIVQSVGFRAFVYSLARRHALMGRVSMGRLFDAVSSLLCLRHSINYEGQAAIELEQIAERDCQQRYEFEVSDDGSIIRAQNVIRAAVEDLRDGVPPGFISAKFHLAVAYLIAKVSRSVREDRKLNRVALSGGVFQNVFLLRATTGLLRSDGFEVFTHSRVPTNDGGISLGQAAIANALLRNG